MIPLVVIDTNLFISGIFHGGLPAKLLLRLATGDVQAVFTDATFAELQRKLRSPNLRPNEDTEQILNDIVEFSSTVRVLTPINVCRDPDDNRMLECAVAANADFILTGDKDLLVLHPFENIPILTVRQFFDRNSPSIT